MYHRLATLALVVVVCISAFSSGCIYDDDSNEIVVKEKICVQFNEYRESGNFESTAVCPQFRERLDGILEENGVTYDDLKSLHMVGADYKVVKLQGHDWTMQTTVKISRQDDPSGPVTDGPVVLLNETESRLKKLLGKPTNADLNEDGVDLVNRALEDLLDGDDPRLVLTLMNTEIEPVPSPEDPLEVRFLVCVEFQAVLELPKKDHDDH